MGYGLVPSSVFPRLVSLLKNLYWNVTNVIILYQYDPLPLWTIPTQYFMVLFTYMETPKTSQMKGNRPSPLSIWVWPMPLPGVRVLDPTSGGPCRAPCTGSRGHGAEDGRQAAGKAQQRRRRKKPSVFFFVGGDGKPHQKRQKLDGWKMLHFLVGCLKAYFQGRICC